MYYVYVIQSLDEDKKRYIGYSSDLRKRIDQHNCGMNTSTAHRQWRLVYYEAYLNEEDAKVRERRLKHDGRARRQLYARIERSLLD